VNDKGDAFALADFFDGLEIQLLYPAAWRLASRYPGSTQCTRLWFAVPLP
jgi:hypothetical protein